MSALETAYTQDFDTLSSMSTSSTLPTGWHLDESGTSGNVDGMYAIGSGTSNSGDTYSYGVPSTTERALGTLRSTTLTPIIGAGFTNGTGSAIGSLSVSYHGEQWRVGAVGRVDRLDFQYSLDATSITTGTWVDVNTLDFTGPDQAGPVSGVMGARIGNDATHQVTISGVVTASVAVGATIWIRWTDFAPAAGANDGLAVDDFSITPHAAGNIAFDVFFDANGNGTHDTGENGIGGWGIALDGGASQNTAADGSTTFTGVSTSSHTVMNTPPTAAGTWSATFPATVTTTAGATTTYHVAVTCTCPDDGDLCTSIPVCNAGACPAAMPINCDDVNVCTNDSCALGVCAHVPNTLACSDGMTTTRNDVCTAGTCVGMTYSCTPGTCEATSVPNGVDCTVTYSSSATLCGSSTSCDHCSGTSAMCIATSCAVDAGTDAGNDAAVVTPDAGHDAAVVTPDAGNDAAVVLPDAGNDAAVVLADAGNDAATVLPDAGSDAGAAADDAGMDAAVDDAGLDGGVADDAGGDASTGLDASASDSGVVADAGDAGRDGGARDGSTLDGTVHDAAVVTTPPSMNCGCTTAGRSTPSGLWLGLLGLAIFVWRRRK